MGLRVDGIGEGYDVWHKYGRRDVAAVGGVFTDYDRKDLGRAGDNLFVAYGRERMSKGRGRPRRRPAVQIASRRPAVPIGDVRLGQDDGIMGWTDYVKKAAKDFGIKTAKGAVSAVAGKIVGKSGGGAAATEDVAPKTAKSKVPWVPIGIGVGALALLGMMFRGGHHSAA